MRPGVADLVQSIRADPWRESVAFSPDFARAQQAVLAATTGEDVVTVLREWLARNQPCLFGRIAAKRNLLSFCVLEESALLQSDVEIQRHIQEERLQWTRAGFTGARSGFILFVRSERLARGEPGPEMLSLAKRLAELYLLQEVETGQICFDELFLEIQASPTLTYKWLCGVNYFCAQGDGRWWQDHRIPGGLAFSVNSVGHMVKSGMLARALGDLRSTLDLPVDCEDLPLVHSLPQALDLAMRTISLAGVTEWGRATELIEGGDGRGAGCPIDLPPALRGKDHNEYRGYYHTDQTLPLEYFDPRAARSPDATPCRLDFTYLFRDESDNPAHLTMAKGVRIRSDDEKAEAHSKGSRAQATVVHRSCEPRLVRALA